MKAPLRSLSTIMIVAAITCLNLTTTVQAQESGDSAKLKAIGGLAAGHMYSTYLAIGATADAFGAGVYDKEQVKNLMGGLVGMMDNLKKQLLEVQEGLSDEGDIAFIDETVTILGLLQEEGRQLSAFAESGDTADFRAYDKARQTVWPKITKLLGLDEE